MLIRTNAISALKIVSSVHQVNAGNVRKVFIYKEAIVKYVPLLAIANIVLNYKNSVPLVRIVYSN